MALVEHPEGGTYDAPDDVVHVYLENGWRLLVADDFEEVKEVVTRLARKVKKDPEPVVETPPAKVNE